MDRETREANPLTAPIEISRSVGFELFELLFAEWATFLCHDFGIPTTTVLVGIRVGLYFTNDGFDIRPDFITNDVKSIVQICYLIGIIVDFR